MISEEQLEYFAIKVALGNNGGTWAEHYKEHHKEYWRNFVRKLMIEMENYKERSK